MKVDYEDHRERINSLHTRAECRECGCEIGAGYLCDDCDQLEVEP